MSLYQEAAATEKTNVTPLDLEAVEALEAASETPAVAVESEAPVEAQDEIMHSGVQKVFGKFAVSVDGKVELFDNLAEANAASVEAEAGNEISETIEGYLADKDYTDRKAKQVGNVLREFLLHQAAK